MCRFQYLACIEINKSWSLNSQNTAYSLKLAACHCIIWYCPLIDRKATIGRATNKDILIHHSDVLTGETHGMHLSGFGSWGGWGSEANWTWCGFWLVKRIFCQNLQPRALSYISLNVRGYTNVALPVCIVCGCWTGVVTTTFTHSDSQRIYSA